MKQPGVVQRLNSRVTTLDGPVIEFSGAASDLSTTSPADVPAPSLARTVGATLRYVEFSPKAKAVTFWVVADFDTPQVFKRSHLVAHSFSQSVRTCENTDTNLSAVGRLQNDHRVECFSGTHIYPRVTLWILSEHLARDIYTNH